PPRHGGEEPLADLAADDGVEHRVGAEPRVATAVPRLDLALLALGGGKEAVRAGGALHRARGPGARAQAETEADEGAQRGRAAGGAGHQLRRRRVAVARSPGYLPRHVR